MVFLALAAATFSLQVTPGCAECCFSNGIVGIGDGICKDGSGADPCCGVGSCGLACCDCNGGCREAAVVKAPGLEPTKLMRERIDLNQWPMLSAHDSATSYAREPTCTPHAPINSYAVTQPKGGYRQLLDCGARALDMRPWLKADGTLILHHGAVKFDTPLARALADVVEWSDAHADTFVLVQLGHFGGDEDTGGLCKNRSFEALDRAGIRSISGNAIRGMKLGSAMELGRLPGGGSVLGVSRNDVHANYEEEVQCYGNVSDRRLDEGGASAGEFRTTARRFSCRDETQQPAFERFWEYMANISNTTDPPHKDGLLWTTQAHWQYDAELPVQGAANRSCILKDEREAGVNRKLAARIRSGDYRHFNLLEVDNVCDSGADLFLALREFARKQADPALQSKTREDLGHLLHDYTIDLNSNEFDLQADGTTVHANVTIIFNVTYGARKSDAHATITDRAQHAPISDLLVVDDQGRALNHTSQVLEETIHRVRFTFAEPIQGPATYTVHLLFRVEDGICVRKCERVARDFMPARWASSSSIPVRASTFRLRFAPGSLRASKPLRDVCVQVSGHCQAQCGSMPSGLMVEFSTSGNPLFLGFSWPAELQALRRPACEGPLRSSGLSGRLWLTLFWCLLSAAAGACFVSLCFSAFLVCVRKERQVAPVLHLELPRSVSGGVDILPESAGQGRPQATVAVASGDVQQELGNTVRRSSDGSGGRVLPAAGASEDAQECADDTVLEADLPRGAPGREAALARGELGAKFLGCWQLVFQEAGHPFCHVAGHPAGTERAGAS